MKTMTNEIVLVSLIAQILAVSGCHPGAVSPGAEMAEHRAQRSIQIDFAAGATLVVRNTAGAIRVRGGDVTCCQTMATIRAGALTERQARDLGDQVQVAAEPNDGALVITVKRPPVPQSSVYVDLDIHLPRQAHVDCKTHWGRIALSGIAGNVKASTGRGSILCESTQGSLDLVTGVGDVVGRQVVSDHVVARSARGSVDVSCADACPGEVLADISTAVGTARFKAPPQYQGALALEAWYGSVKLDAPTNVRDAIRREMVRERLDSGRGTIRHEKVTGHIGSGKGNVRLATNLGSVRWR